MIDEVAFQVLAADPDVGVETALAAVTDDVEPQEPGRKSPAFALAMLAVIGCYLVWAILGAGK